MEINRVFFRTKFTHKQQSSISVEYICIQNCCILTLKIFFKVIKVCMYLLNVNNIILDYFFHEGN